MISEVSFSRGFASFWTEYTPWLGDYVSSINKGIGVRIEVPIEIGNDTIHRAINNVVAFSLFKNLIEHNEDSVEKAFTESVDIMKNFPRNNLETYKLSNEYKVIITILSKRLINRYKQRSPEFYPQFSGCGIMESCQGDLLYDDTLVEIKAGERGLQSSDVKQIITYCALNWLSGSPLLISQIEFYNPRQGILWKSELSDLIISVSSLPLEDLFDQIGKYLSELSENIEL